VSEPVPQTPYEILGEKGVRALAAAFYDVMEASPDAQEIRAMHAADLEPMKRKLATYLIGWMGGPPVYLAINGTVCLTDPHAPYHIGPRQRDQWLACMAAALERIGASDELKAMLKEPLFRVADTVRNSDVSEPKPRDPSIIAVG
jgi:hemoglobin